MAAPRHRSRNEYTNLDGTTPDKGFGDLVKWFATRSRAPDDFVTPRRENDGSALFDHAAHITWIGHATFAMKIGGATIATDPIWSERLGPRKRRTKPGVSMEKMPPIDVVTISHSHRDHFDLPTLERIGPKATYVVPKDNAPLLKGMPNVIELDWFESWEKKDLRITLVPAQHWSMRMPWDRNQRLWGGFVYQSPEGIAYHAGDTAMNEEVFGAIANRFPKIDWAMLPIGAYEPQWFMQPQHMGPEEAVRAFEILGAKNLCAMHWGTFKLTDEPTGEPPSRARAAFRHASERLWIFDIGETRELR